MRPHRWQPTRLPHHWDSPGKNTGVGCHFLLQCMKVKSESEVTQSCPTLSDPKNCSPPRPSVHGIFQARVLEWGAIAFSKNRILHNNKNWILDPWNNVDEKKPDKKDYKLYDSIYKTFKAKLYRDRSILLIYRIIQDLCNASFLRHLNNNKKIFFNLWRLKEDHLLLEYWGRQRWLAIKGLEGMMEIFCMLTVIIPT